MRMETNQPHEPQTPILEISGISKRYGRTMVLQDTSLRMLPSEFMVLFGPPSSGKSVLLRILLGLEQPDSGSIRLRGVDITSFAPAERNIGYVPQSFALYPHLSVYDNIAYPLSLAKADKRTIEQVVTRAAEMLAISDLLQKRPDQLSGGQKQRVAIARGIAKQTDFFVLDDPLAGLDFKLREQLVDDLRQLQVETQATFLYSTSDAVEAMTLADTVAVLDEGAVVDSGSPEELYRNPAWLPVARLLGFPQANFLPGALSTRAGQYWCEAGPFAFPVTFDGNELDGPVTVGLRPEAITLGATLEQNGWQIVLPARITLREDLGAEEIVYLDIAGSRLLTVERHDDERTAGADETMLLVRPSDLMIYAADGRRIGQGDSAHG